MYSHLNNIFDVGILSAECFYHAETAFTALFVLLTEG